LIGGTCYIRTDQLDGETDWKLKHSLSVFQQLKLNEDILSVSFEVIVEQPQKDLYSFAGNLKYRSPITNELNEEPLSVLNTTWSNSVLATGSIVGMVIYTGKDTRAILHTSSPRVKSGQADNEINNLTKLLFLIMIIMAVVMLSLKGFSGLWYVFLLRYIILLSYIIPISLRVNLDMAKLVYGWIIQHDANIKNTIVRNSTIPEELGRIEYMLTDKTGTLTNNEMIFKKLHIGSTCFSAENSNEIMNSIHNYYTNSSSNMSNDESLVKCVLALSLCHNVTPVSENVNNVKDSSDDCEDKTLFNEAYQTTGMTYQASSPDEIALVKWAALVDLALIERDHSSLCIQLPDDSSLEYDILHLFPFNSERKRMGIIVKNRSTNLISFYMKGADVVMKHIVQYSDWLDDECGNLSREGLRTLVFGKKDLTENEFYNFDHRYKQAQMSLCDRDAATVAVLDSIENNLELLCITGVEDTLQVCSNIIIELKSFVYNLKNLWISKIYNLYLKPKI
jgi:phospholipid-translocating ATPase